MVCIWFTNEHTQEEEGEEQLQYTDVKKKQKNNAICNTGAQIGGESVQSCKTSNLIGAMDN